MNTIDELKTIIFETIRQIKEENSVDSWPAITELSKIIIEIEKLKII